MIRKHRPPGGRRPVRVAVFGADPTNVARSLAARSLGIPLVGVAPAPPGATPATGDADAATEAARALAEDLGAPVEDPEALVARLAAAARDGEVVVALLGAGAVGLLGDVRDTGASVLVDHLPTRPLDPAAVDGDARTGPDRLAVSAHLCLAPLVVAAGPHVAALGPAEHLEVRAVSVAGGGPDPDPGEPAHPGDDGPAGAARVALEDPGRQAVAALVHLAALAGAGDPAGAQASATAQGALLQVRFAGGLVGRAELARRPSPATPQWSAQAAGPSGTVRVELAPVPGLERDGEPVPARPAEAPSWPPGERRPGPAAGPDALRLAGYAAEVAAVAGWAAGAGALPACLTRTRAKVVRDLLVEAATWLREDHLRN